MCSVCYYFDSVDSHADAVDRLLIINPSDLEAWSNMKSHTCFHAHDVHHTEFNMVAMEVLLLPILEGH